MNSTNVGINPERMRQAFRKRGINPTEAARRTGCSMSYYHVAMKRMTLPVRAVVLLESVLGIKPEEYVMDRQPPVKRPSGIDYDALREIVKDAVREALEEAMQ